MNDGKDAIGRVRVEPDPTDAIRLKPDPTCEHGGSRRVLPAGLRRARR
jgi:hypothetical protein